VTLGVISVSGGRADTSESSTGVRPAVTDSPRPAYRAGRGDRHDLAGDEVIEQSAIAASVA
jgi:hypothetical protein